MGEVFIEKGVWWTRDLIEGLWVIWDWGRWAEGTEPTWEERWVGVWYMKMGDMVEGSGTKEEEVGVVMM